MIEQVTLLLPASIVDFILMNFERYGDHTLINYRYAANEIRTNRKDIDIAEFTTNNEIIYSYITVTKPTIQLIIETESNIINGVLK